MVFLTAKKHGFLKGLLVTLGLVGAGAAAVAVEKKVVNNKKVKKALTKATKNVVRKVAKNKRKK